VFRQSSSLIGRFNEESALWCDGRTLALFQCEATARRRATRCVLYLRPARATARRRGWAVMPIVGLFAMRSKFNERITSRFGEPVRLPLGGARRLRGSGGACGDPGGIREGVTARLLTQCFFSSARFTSNCSRSMAVAWESTYWGKPLSLGALPRFKIQPAIHSPRMRCLKSWSSCAHASIGALPGRAGAHSGWRARVVAYGAPTQEQKYGDSLDRFKCPSPRGTGGTSAPGMPLRVAG
jgi:hypothetical protein